jgi:O-antigen/teichoic acid export membrane protein
LIYPKQHILSGIRWTFLTSVLRRSIGLVLFYFIANWLTKTDFGVFREYNLLLVFMTGISQLSLDNLLIVNRRHSQIALFSLWKTTLLSALVITLLFPLLAGVFGNWYDSYALTRLLMFTSIFAALEVVRRAVRSLAISHQQFRQIALAETANVLFYSVLSLIILFFYRQLWIYLVLFYLGNAVETIWLWNVNKAQILLQLSRILQGRYQRVCSKVLLRNGSFLGLSTAVYTLNQTAGNAPILILGLLVAPEQMGIFYFASQIIGLPVGMFTTAINQVFYPVFAGQKDADIGKLTSRYVRMVGLIGLPVLLIFSYVMGYAVLWLFGEKWIEAIALIPIMFVLYGFSLYCSSISGIPFVKRKPSWELIWNIVALIIRIGAMLLGMRVSFIMALWMYALASAVMYLVFYLMSMQLIKIRWQRSLLNLLASLMPTVLLAELYYLLTCCLPVWQILFTAAGWIILLMVINVFFNGTVAGDIRMLLSRSDPD